MAFDPVDFVARLAALVPKPRINLTRYLGVLAPARPAPTTAGADWLHQLYEGDWVPRRLVLVEFPSIADLESFYYGPVYAEFKSLRDECSSGRLVGVEGL